MDLKKEQIVMLETIWSILKDKLITFIGKTRNRNVTLVTAMEINQKNMLKLFSNYTDEE